MNPWLPRIRHRFAPQPEACRWCGVPYRQHGMQWIPGKGYHAYARPTTAQIEARMRSRRGVVKSE